jgi:uncharacterized protein YcnI
MTRGNARDGAHAMAWGLIGVLGGHRLTYAILFPDAHVRDRILDESGHGWTALLGPAIMTAVAIALALGLLSGLGRGRARGVRFTTLLLLQAGLFAGIEIAERIASSGLTVASLQHHLVDHGLAAILLVGALIQVLTAWFGSTVSRVVASVACRPRPAPSRRRLAHSRLAPFAMRVPAPRMVRAQGSRGPPLCALIPAQTIYAVRASTIGRAFGRDRARLGVIEMASLLRNRRSVALLAAAVATVAVALPAAAHITIPESGVPAGGSAVIHFRVPHGCEGAATDTIEVQLPDGVVSGQPEYIPGWTVETEMVESEPYERFGETLTERVGVIRWSGGSLPDLAYLDFGVRATFLADEGAVIAFPVVQRCGDAEEAWIEPTVEGEEEPEFPAPTVTVGPPVEGQAD